MPPLPRNSPLLLAAVLALGLAMPALAASFQDVTVSPAGIVYTQHNLPSETDFQTYMTGGAAAGDYDNDGNVDLYVTRLDDTDILYRNLGTGSFQDVTATAFGAGHMAAVQSNGCAWGDVENDGDLDLYVTSIKSNRYHLFINDGLGNFTEEAVLRGADVPGADTHYGQSVSFGDYDRDGFIDIHVTEWRIDAQNPGGAPHNNRLLRNKGLAMPGHFEDVTIAAGVTTDGWPTPNPDTDSQGFSPRFIDLDFDGHPELTIASDHRTSRLFWNNGNGTFTDGTDAANVGTDSYGMGSTFGDFDGDGDFDWFVTSIFDNYQQGRNGNRLYRYDGNRTFSDHTTQSGVRDGFWGWGTAFFDYDHDGDLDLVQTNGADFPFNPGVSAGFENDPTRLWQNNGSGQFFEISGPGSGIDDNLSGKGLLTFDYDNDGDLDVFIVNNGASPILYQNIAGTLQDWLKIVLQGTVSNRDGFGARLTVLVQHGTPALLRFADGGNNFLGQSSKIVHYGIGGTAGPALHAVIIRWPSGIIQALDNVARNQAIAAVEPGPGNLPQPVDVTVTELTPGNDFEIGWPAVPGCRYLVEATEDFSRWRDFRVVVATGATATCIDDTRAGVPRRYYRVRKVSG